MLSRYISSADGFVVVYSVGSRKSFEHALYLFSQIARVRGVNSIARMLVAAKCDSDYREVSPEEGNTLSAQLSCSFAEASARTNINVYEVGSSENVKAITFSQIFLKLEQGSNIINVASFSNFVLLTSDKSEDS
ncbi:Ras family protein [Oesophagostomum dentatum]|uniref:Ras family protein n=1 Tax=Oesophagostomum dentatum TaxID=61180 RepID=A0A0B1RQ58_OESDE|nr:Ras family protein [Oesophagostomum dentatum]